MIFEALIGKLGYFSTFLNFKIKKDKFKKKRMPKELLIF